MASHVQPLDPATADLAAVDLTDLDLWADGPPHQLFARMRAETPVRWNPSADGHGFWSLTRGADISTVNQDPGTFSSANGIWFRPDAVGPLNYVRNLSMLKDPPEHTRYRGIVAKAFLPRTLVLVDQLIRDSVTQALDKIVEQGQCDLVRDIAVPVPVNVIGRLLGAPPEDMDQLVAWTAEIERGITHAQDVTPTLEKMAGHFRGLVNNQVVRGIDSLAKSVAEAEVDGQRLTEGEIALYFALLLYAGNHPTRDAISSGLLALIHHPAQLEALRATPSLLRCTQSGLPTAALQEILRWTTPVNYFARTATKDTTLGGVPIKADDRLVMWYASANRDPEVIADPDRFDINRPVREIADYAFGGGGPHRCQGAFLAIKTLSVALPHIIKRLPDLQLAGPTTRVRSIFANSLATMPVTFRPSP
jgi:cytochrome P450